MVFTLGCRVTPNGLTLTGLSGDGDQSNGQGQNGGEMAWLNLPSFQNFESLVLGPNLDETLISESAWTKAPPLGWSIDDSGVPCGNPTQDGVTNGRVGALLTNRGGRMLPRINNVPNLPRLKALSPLPMVMSGMISPMLKDFLIPS